MSRAVIRTADLNPHKLLFAVLHENIPLFRVKRTENFTQFEIPAKHLSKLLEISSRLCYTVSVECYTGAAGMLRWLALRWATLVAIPLAIALVVGISSRLRSISVRGAEDAESEVRSAIAAAGAVVGSPRRAVDRDAVRAAVEALPRVASAVVTLDGVRLNVSVRLAATALETEEHREGARIVARCDGVVTGIAVIAGTPKVKVGDLVRRGDTLIEGADPLDPDVALTPRGIVYANVWFGASEEFFPERVVETFGEGVVTVRELLLCGKVWYPARHVVPFARYDVTVSTTPLAHGVLPLAVRETTYRELVEERIVCDFETERAAIEERVLAEARRRVERGCTVTDEFVTVTEESDKIRVRGVIQTGTVISVAV